MLPGAQHKAMINLNVKGMTCGHCADAVTAAVKSVDADANIQVDVGHGLVQVETRSAAEALVKAIGLAGYSATPTDDAASIPSSSRSCCCGTGACR